MKKENKFTIIRDTREQNGWDFSGSESVIATLPGALKTGDYTIQGFEHLLCIERKATVVEFAQNSIADRFKKELLRMLDFPFKFIVCEFDYAELIAYPLGPTVPFSVRKTARLTGKFLMRFVSELQVNYQIPIVLAGNANHAKYAALNIMKRVYEKQA